MPRRNSTLWTYYDYGTPASEMPCEVLIEGDGISIAFADDHCSVVYKGQASSPGHYRLECVSGSKGRGTLHRFDDDDVLEGWWFENGSEGMWRIHLH